MEVCCIHAGPALIFVLMCALDLDFGNNSIEFSLNPFKPKIQKFIKLETFSLSIWTQCPVT
jgi:hypothetical protein